MLTDSGGFQVFSLEGLRAISEDGVEFQSHIDGTYRTLTPESAMEIQWTLGADVAMAFDHVVPGQAPHELAQEGMERTLRWLDRCARARGTRELAEESRGRRQTLWPIIQGGTHDDLRLRSLEGILARGPWTGVAIGGLSVGEPKPVMHRVLEALEPALPQRRPPLSYGGRISGGSARGNRARRGPVRLRRRHAERPPRHRVAADGPGQREGRRAQGSTAPLDAECDCETCTHLSPRLSPPPVHGRKTCSGSGWCRSTTSASWSGSASRRGRTSWTGRSTAGAATGSAATTPEDDVNTLTC